MNALEKAIEDINKRYKKPLIRKGVDYEFNVQQIPFSSPRATYMTYGGVPLGRGTEFFGPENGGKTTSALVVTGQAQQYAKNEFNAALNALQSEYDALKEKDNKSDQKRIAKLEKDIKELTERGPRQVVYMDLENTLDLDWAIKLGVDVDALYLFRPDDETAEQILQIALDLMDSGLVILLVIDSLPMLVSKKVYDETLDKKAFAGIADTAAEFSRKATPIISRNNTAVIVINQIREDMKNPDNVYNTPGGKALKHWFSLRLYFRKGSYINNDNEEVPLRTAEPAGNMVDIQIIKTKICKPDRRVGQYTLRYDIGVDVISDTVFLAVKYGFITKNGAWYYLMDQETGEVIENADEELKFQGEAKLLEYLREDDEIFDEIYQAVNAKLAEIPS